MATGRGRLLILLATAALVVTSTACGSSTASTGPTTPATMSDRATSSATAASSATATSSASEAGAGADYCLSTGGFLERRQPTFNTNGPASGWVPLGDPVQVCHYAAADGSRIYLDPITLSSARPTLAALAYLAKIPLPNTTNGANPAALGCTALAGTSQFGLAAAAGGGLVNTDDPEFTVVNPCTFADGSFIDEWGIAYYADGKVRGKDLTEVFRFDQTKVPDVFGSK